MAAAHAQESSHPATEDVYFANFPVVLTASRLDQPQNEAPGAITVIDRHTIRQSGARTLAEVLRLVPGYLSGGWNGANPVAAYHIPIDDYGARNLVLIDGRPVYSSIYMGDTHRGMMDVMLEDIERIEVLRGANSAAYGANAMFGVINIITRHSIDSDRAEVSFTSGNNGIRDHRVSFSGGNATTSFRLSGGEQRDAGYLNAFDDMRLGQLHGRIDIKPNAVDDVMLKASVSYLAAGEGSADEVKSPIHTTYSRDSSFNAVWRHQVAGTDEFKLSLNYMEDWRSDVTPYPPLPQVMLDFSGVGCRTNIELQHKMTLNPEMRAVLGAGYKDERALSEPLFSRSEWVSFHEERAFGTLEWRTTPNWLLNVGLFVGQHSRAGVYTAPRLMVNWLASPEHTFRAGLTESVRTPSLTEYEGDIRYSLNGVLLAQTVAARGNVEPERLRSQELGYLGRFPSNKLTLDVRAYHERMGSVIGNVSYNRSTPLPVSGLDVSDYVNKPGFDLVGIEGQLRWKPTTSGEIWLNHSFEDLVWDNPTLNTKDERRPPHQATTLAWFQKLSDPLQLSVIHQRLGAMSWRDNRDWLPAMHRTDVRLAYSFLVDTTQTELSFTVQSVEGKQPVFLTRKNLELGRKAFVQLKLAI